MDDSSSIVPSSLSNQGLKQVIYHTLLFTIIPLQKQSTETDHEMKERILGRKETCQSRDLHFDHYINDHSSKNITKTRTSITKINLIIHRTTKIISQQNGNSQNCQIHFYNRIDENTTKIRNFITTINQNGLETNQTILRPNVPVKVLKLLSQSYC